MKYVSAGHCNVKGNNFDPGAPGVNARWEANETVKLRDQVIANLKANGYTDIVQDLNSENRNQYFSRIKTGDGSTVVEFHLNAGTPSATGTEALVGVDADRLDKAMAADFASITASILNIKNRGVKSEADTRHKRLGLMRETGIVCLVEVCFISNASDMAAYDKNFELLCQSYANIIIKYDNIIR
ncbi:MAG TPA: N-acetylmuramoyl-L-alanine amidase [Chitinophagaceae bacterium]|jgi:N-acetylmuramoyl-L-alanine amidase|nr:N-acetylmuramoyl-L-alanine amidase [Chitinophagaceae bacterium]